MTLDEMIELAKTDPWWKEIKEEVDRQWNLLQYEVPDLHKIETVNALIEVTEIGDDKLEGAANDPVFQQAKAIISNLRQGDSYPNELFDLFRGQIPGALAQINKYALQLIALITDKTLKSKAEDLWKKRAQSLADIRDMLQMRKVITLKNRFILSCLADLIEREEYYKNDPSPFMSDTYLPMKLGEEQRDRVDFLAYRVFDPLWIFTFERFEPEYVSFPLKWVPNLPSNVLRELYREHKHGTNVLLALISHFESQEELEHLAQMITSCPIISQFSDLFAEIVQSYRQGLYNIASVSLLSVIEGMVWAYAWWWNRFFGPVFDRSTSSEDYSKCSFKLISSTGKTIKNRPTVGTLLRATSFGEHFYHEEIEYFCEDLFNERDPVMHGRNPRFGNKEKAATFLFVVWQIERTITGSVKDHFAKTIIDSIPEEQRRRHKD